MNIKSKLLVMFLAIILMFSGCEKEQDKLPSEDNRIKIGVALYRQDDTYISNLMRSFQDGVKLLEAEKNITVTVDIVDGKSNQALQNDQVDRFLAHDYDVICVNMVDRTAAAVVIDKAKTADIPVIFFNREPVEEDLLRWNKLYYVGAAAKLSGEIQGKFIVDLYKGDIASIDKNRDGTLQYVMIEGEAGQQDALIRTEYSVKTITNAGIRVEKLSNSTANWQKAQASSAMSTWIEKYGNQIELVLCNNDDMALGAIDALEKSNQNLNPVIVGVDGTPPALKAIAEGKMLGTAVQDIKGQAKSMLNISYSLASGLPIEGEELINDKYVLYPYYPVSIENVSDFIDME